jgi:hypothetical protein
MSWALNSMVFLKDLLADNATYKLTDTILNAWNKKIYVAGFFMI